MNRTIIKKLLEKDRQEYREKMADDNLNLETKNIITHQFNAIRDFAESCLKELKRPTPTEAIKALERLDEEIIYTFPDGKIRKISHFKDYEIIKQALEQESKKKTVSNYDVLQYFTDLSRGEMFEYQGIKIFYNEEFETFALMDEINIIPVELVYEIIKSLLELE